MLLHPKTFPHNKNVANSFLRAIELFIWFKEEKRTEAIPNVNLI